MATLGLELCDAGFQATVHDHGRNNPLPLPDAGGTLGWMGLVSHDGKKISFGREAEDNWFVHPRRICHNFWSRLSRESSALTHEGRALSFSQLAYYFLSDYRDRLAAVSGTPEKVMLAVPGAYLKDAATEDEKIGLLLGMASELKLPLAGIIDMACAAVNDPRLDYFDRTQPLLVIDIHLHGAEITLLRKEGGRFLRHDFSELPQAGYAGFLRHAMTAMGNRFLRHTTFDILENGHIEQAFYRQMKQFLTSGAEDHHFQINTGSHAYELTATREQLAADAAALIQTLVHGVRALSHKSSGRPESCTVALTDRAGLLPGIAAQFRAAGLTSLLQLPSGAAASGAACAGTDRPLPEHLADVSVETASPAASTEPVRHSGCEIRLLRARRTDAAVPPTHAICEGLGRALAGQIGFTIGPDDGSVDLALPVAFQHAGESGRIRLEHQAGRWWLFHQQVAEADGGTVVETGDRLTLRYGPAETEVLFANCPATPDLSPRRA